MALIMRCDAFAISRLLGRAAAAAFVLGTNKSLKGVRGLWQAGGAWELRKDKKSSRVGRFQ